MSSKYTFSGHESFPCKSLWLKKGYDFVAAGKNFNNPDAIIDLGVGKNMVTSIRFWLKVFGIYNSNDGLTELGHYLFNLENGKDKYIEDIATLWLLHFHIVFSEEASLYKIFFCSFQKERSQFERNQVISHVKYKMISEGKHNFFTESTIKKDLGVLLLNYALPRNAKSNEDYSALLIDLDLIRQNSERSTYYFNIEGKRKVPEEIFLYALLKYREKIGDNTVAYEDIQDNIGLIFCMQDGETIDMLKNLAKKFSDSMAYSDVAGIRQIQFINELDYTQVLDRYYEANI